jgi:hypothetical protein
VAASNQPGREVADDRLRAARLSLAKRGHGRCDDGDPHQIDLV